MKRKLLLTLAAIVATITAGAQTVTQGSLDFMADVHEMFIECEFDQAIVYDRGNLPIAQWGVERDDECDEPTGTFMNNLADVEVDIAHEMVEIASDKFKDIRFSSQRQHDYKLTCHLKEVNHKGQYADCDYIFTNTRTGQTLAVVSIKCKGGKFGTFVNLLGDSCRDSFKKLLKLLARK